MKFTFWKLLSEIPIEIPIIQRDYAQGREGAQIKHIRNNFLDTLLDQLISQEKSIDLDFIYGSVQGKKFIPLDGQQRLTTLFLIHWYIAVRSQQVKNHVVKEQLSRFSYETRISSREFCHELVSRVFVTDKDVSLTVSAQIADSAWFYLSWQKDPTVKAMLTMIDAIDSKFRILETRTVIDYTSLWNRLTIHAEQQAPITFQLLRIDKLKLTDQLYVRMNARGKALTTFEHFKAWFEQLIDDHTREEMVDKWLIEIEDWKERMDKAWTDLFWQHRQEGSFTIDKAFMRYINVMALNHYASKSTQQTDLQKAVDLFTGQDKATKEDNIIYNSTYKEYGCFDEESVNDIFKTLAMLQNGHDRVKTYLKNSDLLDEEKLFSKITNSKQRLSYKERVQFFAYCKFLIRYPASEGKLKNWIRVIRNLTENTNYNNPIEYAESIRSITSLLNFGPEILTYLSSTTDKISGFDSLQVEEEKIKACLILQSKKWEQAISEVENHSYFFGQIGFLLDFAGISKSTIQESSNWTDKEAEIHLDSFNSYASKAKAVFSDKGLNDFDDFLWERALLCKGDYLLRQGRNHSFLINNDRDISWKRLLRDNSKERGYVKALLDAVEAPTLTSDLNLIIENYKNDDWKKFFIKFPSIIKACGSRRLIRWNNEHDILLLKSTTTSGYHKEYYSFALYLRLNKEQQDPTYQSQRSVDYAKCISALNGHKLSISYVPNKQAYIIKEANADQHDFDSEDSLLDYLKANNYLINQTEQVSTLQEA
ncbi:DUF262 domain-containing protein [uncultured Pontibacter sp.]|uniref:DUF262 domain-containing protein n=1 Tax=uncultured Pontibacter sp. TaxID=453356 RepID=UPI002613E21F|nr:DUF262 domain-containing protein [uncultured Pontibacter sp.]